MVSVFVKFFQLARSIHLQYLEKKNVVKNSEIRSLISGLPCI